MPSSDERPEGGRLEVGAASLRPLRPCETEFEFNNRIMRFPTEMERCECGLVALAFWRGEFTAFLQTPELF